MHAGRYAQQAFDTHPTGMHSCNFCHWSILFRHQCSTVNSRSFLFEGKCAKYLQSILLFRNVLSFHKSQYNYHITNALCMEDTWSVLSLGKSIISDIHFSVFTMHFLISVVTIFQHMAKELTLPGTPVTVIDIPTKHAVCSEVKSLSASMWTETATCRGLRLCQVRIDSLFNLFVFSIFFTLKKYPRNSWNGSPPVGVLSFPTSRKNCAQEKNLFCQFPGRQVIGTFYWYLGNIIVRRKFIFSRKGAYKPTG